MKVNSIIFGLLLALALLSIGAATPADAREQGPAPLPAYTYTTAAGESTTLAFPAGSKTILHFWATWCAPCIKELPLLDALAARLAPDPSWRVLAVALDENQAQVQSFLKRHNIKRLQADVDLSLQAMRALKVGGLPTTLIIDDQGRELKRYVGDYDWTTFNTADLSVAEPKPLY